ncbi:hypothetical protein BC832DRAFT_569974 [Gaertneriomyces semiglobifer]|nr:hypothetical protein BC832DRAFT_569974 [Gaertneriomyces semiglobifer]
MATATLPDLKLFDQATLNMGKIAITSRGSNYSYGQLLHDATNVQSLISQASNTYSGGDCRASNPVDRVGSRRVAFLCPRSYEYVVAQWGVWSAGAVAVPLCNHPPPELEYTVTDSQSDTVLVHSAFASHVAPLREKMPSVRWIDLPDIPQKSVSDLALTCALWSGATCEFLDPFEPHAVWKRWLDPARDLSLFMAVPTIYSKMAHVYNEMSPEEQREAKAACAQFRLMVSGSAALPETVFNEWEGISGHKLLERYGMTEIGMGLGNPYEGPRIPGTVGVPFPGVEARIVNENGVDVTNNPKESGELLIRGPQVFKEYWNRREATQEAKTEDWFRTGDIVSRDQSGVFKILGRASQDIIKTGGYKISALEIERELLDDSRIQDAAVVGLPSEEWGEIVGAVVVFKKARGLTLSRDLIYRLANYKIPRVVKVVENMPRNPMGKVNKKELRKIFAPMKE